MKNISRHTGKLHITERMKNSTNGNPRFRCFVVDSKGNGVSFVTAVDSSHGYSITNFEGKEVIVTVGTHYNTTTLNTIEKAE